LSKQSEKKAKQPDMVTAQLKKSFEWTTQHSQITMAAVGAFLVTGFVWGGLQWMQNKKEVAAQEKYFSVENEYLQKKTKFQEGKDLKETGDAEKDYGASIAGFQSVIQNHPGTKAAKMAALAVSEIYIKYKMAPAASDALTKTKPESDRSLMSSLVMLQLGNVYADDKKCDQALTWWNKISAQDNLFLNPDLHLQKGLCYESLKQLPKAEENYNQVLAEAKDSNAAKSAEKYLRLLKTKAD
jgi:predicted negative regulator of RcsB-dependent stress response